MKLFSYLVAALLCASTAFAAPKTYNLSGKIVGGDGYVVMLVEKDGTTSSVTLGASGNFTFRKLRLSKLRGASLQLVDTEGRFLGPVVLNKKGSKVSTTFSGKAPSRKAFALGTIDLKTGYAALKGKINKTIVASAKISADVNGKPIGAGEMGLVSAPTASVIGIRSSDAPSGEDSDNDGVLNAFDADDDGDLVLDASDPDSAGGDIPYTSLNFDFRRTLNAHVREGLNDTNIDAAIGGENQFSLTFFFSLPQGSPIDGGYVMCDDSLVYCRRNTPVGFYGGVSESTEEFRNRPWSDLLTTEGYPRMEKITVGGSFQSIVASIQPRVGRAQLRPGDVYRVALTRGGRATSFRSLSLNPYFVSIPAIKEYNAGFGTVQVDYDAIGPETGSVPGNSESDPVVLSNDGLLTLTFWRPQRAALRSDESGFLDWGNLHYGVIVDQAQATCAGLYSNVSTDLVANGGGLGTDDSPFSFQGANLNPYLDQRGDRPADAANTVTFTVDIKSCITRAGLSPGIHRLSLSAVGEQVTGGRTAAVQSLVVQVP